MIAVIAMSCSTAQNLVTSVCENDTIPFYQAKDLDFSIDFENVAVCLQQ